MRRSLMAALIACLVVVTGCSGSPGSGGVESMTNAPPTVENSTGKPTTGTTKTAGATTSSPAAGEMTVPSTSSTTARAAEARTRTDQTGSETAGDGSTASGVETSGDEPTDPSARAEAGAAATVTRVIDGDTMEVEFADGRTDTIRLIGVDTPETDAQNTPAEFGFSESADARDHLASWGERATGFATDRLEGERVELYGDPQGDQRGSYGRLLAYVYLGGENFNYELLTEGYARVYESSFEFREAFETAAERARANETGLWAFDESRTGGVDDGSTLTETEEERSITSNNGEPPSASGDYDCSEFDTRGDAQEFLLADDPYRLDADGDGVACESLPAGEGGIDDDSGAASTSEPTTTLATEDTDTETETPTEGGDADEELPAPSGGSDDPYDCSDFENQDQAQSYFDSVSGDPSGLDSDGDGSACESL